MAITVSRTRHGTLCYDDADRPVGASLGLYGEWAEEELYLLSCFVCPGDSIVDVGGNIGTHALAFSRFATERGRVIAIEPQEGVFDLLVFNMLLNGAKHVSCVRALAGERSRMRFVGGHGCSTGNSAAVSFLNVDEATTAEPHPGSLLPLDTIALDDLALERCDLVKIDVEGMELDVLRGAADTISRQRPIIYFEQTSPRHFSEIFELFEAAEYAMFWHAADPFNRNNFREHRQNIFGGTREINVLALPQDKKDRRPLTSQLTQIQGPLYNPPPRQGSVSGWALPATAYCDLPAPQSTSLMISLEKEVAAAVTRAAAAPESHPSALSRRFPR